jgi:protein-disulfide isomerase
MTRSAKAVALLLTAIPAWPQAPQQQEQTISRTQADVIISELRQIRELLEKGSPAAANKPPTPAPEQPLHASLKLGGSDWLGDPKAPLTMVEYADYQCPFCKQFHLNTFGQIVKQYIETGKVRFTSRDLPLDFHANAAVAAQAARCAGEQKQYWPMRDLLIANGDKLSPQDLEGYTRTLKLNAAAFHTCLDGGKYKEAVEKDAAEAAKLSIGGTPTFVIGASTTEGVDGVVVVGAQPFADFETRFKEAIAAVPKAN